MTWTTAVMALLTLLCSCDHKPLIYGGAADVIVRFDWTASPEAAPASMRTLAFSPTALVVEVAVAGHDATTLTLPTGDYRFIGYNSDTEDLYAQGTTFDDYEIASRPTQLVTFSPMFAQTRVVPRAPQTDSQPVVFEPDRLWTGAKGQTFLVKDQSADVILPMQEATTEYRFVINNVENLQYVSELTGTISGMSGSWLPATGRASDTECIIPFSLHNDGQGTLTGRVRTFGHCPGHEDNDHADHMLVIYAMLRDGSKYYYTFDITESMHDANHQWDGGGGSTGETEIPIELSDVPFPQPMYNGTGLHPSVDVWQEVEISLEM